MADDYCTGLVRSASMYTEPPIVHTVLEIKAAAYQVKCNRVTTDDIIEREVPAYLRREAEQKQLGGNQTRMKLCYFRLIAAL